ncbi:MAG TPA: response regulator [Polyangia bacterium]|jgi:CheY-like chemotaxis protein/glycine cleavage system H lipoate-binding protein
MSAHASLLVVDDEEIVCQSCTRIFSRQGFEVETSTDPVEGLRLATHKGYSAILLDLMMPELDGLQFLERLRQADSRVPVILITGYSSVQTAADAMRLQAADYVPKPFTPEEITAAVARVTPLPRGPAAPAVPPAVSAWAAASGDFRFLGQGWAELGHDGTARAGAFFPRAEAQAVVAWRTPRPGELVHRGLPLAEARFADGTTRVVPAPLTGSVLAVNAELARGPNRGWSDPCGAGWLVHLQPRRAEAELETAAARSIVLACADAAREREHRAALTRLGCEVATAGGVDAAFRALRQTRARAVVCDADSLGDSGPELCHQLAAAAPEVRLIVVATGPCPHEAAYRTGRIFYYAVAPYADQEIIDVLDAACGDAATAPAVRRETSALPADIRRLRLTNRDGTTAALLVPGGALVENAGVGAAVIRRLLDAAYPVEVTLGADRLAASDVTRAIAESDRVLLLLPQDSGRIAGTVATRSAVLGGTGIAGETASKVMTFVVQPAPGGLLDYDARTTEALATLIVDALTTTGVAEAG